MRKLTPVQCDQKPPRCKNCQRWGIVCDYTALSAAVAQVYNKNLLYQYNHALIYSYKTVTPPPPSPWLDHQDLELLNHYATRTSLTLSAEETLSIWQGYIPGEAKTHGFLMHSLLALSALHLSYVWPAGRKRDAWFDVANRQHGTALSCFRSHVTSITAENGSAVTAFSFLTVIFNIGLPVVYGFESTPFPTSTFIDVIQVLRTAWGAMSPVLPGIEMGALGPLIKQPMVGEGTCGMHVKGNQVLQFLAEFNERRADTEEEKEIYRGAIGALRKFLQAIRNTPPLWENSLIWPTVVSDAFFELLRRKRPFALILLAHWCIPVYRSPSLWFNQWARNIVADIRRMLEGEFRGAVNWPAQQVGLVPKEEHERGCACLTCDPVGVGVA
ncbi:hypothetical protein K504DRAFT_497961 [Pleomassaria siparia CBS 279.74]|uniref:Zn(2)-C6 fungal-type domain-containing protein n=1 Tax=Pleomassaria siparia CBS 279.74 TaxID=1314801 RepID=A0A6G1KKR1_9PLEO|nr:hypothetical protein K504DRAFT_497961 [Pleomassaria siparia CBS 279.74]